MRYGIIAHGRDEARSGQRDPCVGGKRDLRPGERQLEARCGVGVSDQPVGDPQRRRVGGSAGGHADGSPSRPAEILDGRERACLKNLERHRGTNFTRSPGANPPRRHAYVEKRDPSGRSRQPPGVERG
jgi:hypothetical protein